MTDQDPLDDKLRRYLRQRADVSIPPGLVEGAHLDGRSRAPLTGRWFRVSFGLLTVAVGVLLVASRLLQGAPLQGGGPSPIPSTPAPATSTIPPQTPSDPALAARGFPAEVLGLPVISVAAARGLIAGGQHQGRAMAVGGWWSTATMGMSCPAPMVYKSVVEGYCSLTALAPTDARIDYYQSSGNASSESFRAPRDALQPRAGSEVAGYDVPWKDVPYGSAERQQPQRVVLIGHVGDPRAWMCAAETFQSCKSEFVVDAFAWVEGRFLDAWTANGGVGPWHLTIEAARTAVGNAVKDSRTVTMAARTEDDIAYLDPRISPGTSMFWFARVIVGAPDPQGTSQLEEVLIDDATGAVRTWPLNFAAGTAPGSVDFLADGDFFHQNGQLSALYAAIVDSAGKRLAETYLQTMWNTPAVLPAGDYGVVSWWGDPNSRIVSPSPPVQPPCNGLVHVVSDTIALVTITWSVGSDPLCVIREGGPAPTAAP